MSEKVKKIYFPVYDYTVIVVITDDILKSLSKRKYLIQNKFEGGGIINALHSFDEERAVSVLFFTQKTSAGVIAHESFHCAWRILTWIEATVEEEQFAYLLDYITQQVYDFITISNKKSKC